MEYSQLIFHLPPGISLVPIHKKALSILFILDKQSEWMVKGVRWKIACEVLIVVPSLDNLRNYVIYRTGSIRTWC
jgi:thiamine pyrophosphokinase